MEWPKGSGVDYLWSGGLWVGGIDTGVSAVTTATTELEYLPGPSALDRIYAATEGQVNGRRYPAHDADDDADGHDDEDRLNGRDDDGDGRIDEDYAAISNQMFFCEYSDTDPRIRAQYPDHLPLGLRVQQGSYAWSERSRNEFIAFDYLLVNESSRPLYDVYAGFHADFDIGRRERPGRAADDFAGFWEGIVQLRVGLESRNVKLSLGYMFDDDGDEGTAEGYIGIVCLGGRTQGDLTAPREMQNFRMSRVSASFATGGEPTNDEERYRCLDGTAPRSVLPPNPSTGLRPEQLSVAPGDHGILVSAGPFGSEGLQPGDSISVQFGLVIGRGLWGMIESAAILKLLYDGVWFDRDGDPTTGVQGYETPVCAPAFAARTLRRDACVAECDEAPPADPNCHVTVPDSGCVWINLDCELERYGVVTGIEGAEHLVRWLHPVSTPVGVQDFRGSTSAEGIQLEWALTTDTRLQLRSVAVQRAPAVDGPYIMIVEGLEPLESMRWVDRSMVSGNPLWYRLSLEYVDGTRQTTLAIPVQTGTRAGMELFAPHDLGPGKPVEIRFRVESHVHVRLEIFDAAGRRVRTLDAGMVDPGTHSRTWDRRNRTGVLAARGMYFVRLHAGGRSRVRRLLLAHD